MRFAIHAASDDTVCEIRGICPSVMKLAHITYSEIDSWNVPTLRQSGQVIIFIVIISESLRAARHEHFPRVRNLFLLSLTEFLL